MGFGAMGTIVFFGCLVGSLAGTKIFSNSKNNKSVLMITLFFNAVSLILFTIWQNYYINLTLRFLTGFF